MSEKYEDYAAKVAEAMGDISLQDELVSEHEATQIADYLNAERLRQGLSQRDVAKLMGVSASKICRIEDSYDKDLSYADISMYAKALGVHPVLEFEKTGTQTSEWTERLVLKIASLLDQLKTVVVGSESFQHAIDDFSGKALFPALRMCRER